MATTALHFRQNQLGGNYCGHDNVHPMLRPAMRYKTGKGGRPRVLTRCIERLDRFYSHPRRVLPELDLANGSLRQMRGERRAAVLQLCGSILLHTDLASLCVGQPTETGFLTYSIRFLATKAGIGRKRAERAVQDLKRAGLITVSQNREREPDGTWRSRAAIKTVSERLFQAVNLGRMLQTERKKAVKRARVTAERWLQAPPIFTGARRSFQKSPRAFSNFPTHDVERHRKFLLLAVEIKLANPTWSSTRCHEEAERQLGQLTA